MKLFLDDFRKPENCLLYMHNTPGFDAKIYMEDWKVVTNYAAFIYTVKKNKGKITHVSFDHDLAEEHYHPYMFKGTSVYNTLYKTFKEKTGYDCAKWFKNYYAKNKLNLPIIITHTQNPAGRENIVNLFCKNEILRKMNKISGPKKIDYV